MIERREAVASLLANRGDALVVTGLGSPTYDVFAAGDNPANFYLWGAMGASAMTGLGLALAQPDRPVVVVTGDGEMLMGIGSFATIAQHQPANLSIVILDNEHYAETGMQATATGHGADLAGIAAASGIARTTTIAEAESLAELSTALYAQRGPVVAVLKVSSRSLPRVTPMRDGVALKHRMRGAVLGLHPGQCTDSP
ncbi:MAG: thiamine pyrophosphate-dependent enzyme [Pseudomonadota bacterium]